MGRPKRADAAGRFSLELFAFCLMPNHWHLVVRPLIDGEMGRFRQWLTLTHTQRYHAHYHTAGVGNLYQGRYKSFPVQTDEHFLTLCRYVERNAFAAGLCQSPEQWRWGSLSHWHRKSELGDKMLSRLASPPQAQLDPVDGEGLLRGGVHQDRREHAAGCAVGRCFVGRVGGPEV